MQAQTPAQAHSTLQFQCNKPDGAQIAETPSQWIDSQLALHDRVAIYI
jgi:hypothetical protein